MQVVSGIHDLWLFVVSGLLLAMSPGPDTAYIVGRSSQLGWGGGAIAVLGIATGICVHILCAAAGVSALLLTSAKAFNVIKLAGAAYLLYLGLKLLASKSHRSVVPGTRGQSTGTATKVFWQGFLTNVLNPKVALFFLAFVPQFIAAGTGSKTASFLFLGLIFNMVGTAWNLLVAFVAAHVARRVRRENLLSLWVNRALGGVFIYVGFRLVVARQGR
jgi:threonine/homoserine/homoserine lactone efflux protein